MSLSYLDALESECKQAGIPPRRRARIRSEFADHLRENPEAELGAPRELAREFADVLGTRLARDVAYRAFGVLAIAATVLAVMFIDGGRTYGGWIGIRSSAPLAGLARGLIDASLCMIAFTVLGAYLGLRTSSRPVPSATG